MSEWGEDRYGPFAAVIIGDVTLRFRWIPEGVFLMGSPPTEAGRDENEGPQHEVELTQGYWLGETPVTQTLWGTVMGENPSRFQTPHRPVEQVSWEDCHAFIARMNERIGDGGFRFPTEAEWERACRAGTAGATWRGDLKILGKNNAPLLDEIAWYSGNSGVGFDLKEGVESSDWPEKQYAHTRAGTREVKQRSPNPLGLYDMLGNVWEWCEDRYDAYRRGRMVDPVGPTSGAYRVLRGGSWYGSARYVRAACRVASAPDYRSGSIGFRLARGQGSALKPVRQAQEGRGTRPDAVAWTGRPGDPRAET